MPSRRKRLETVIAGAAPDRTPVLGGWICCPEHICALAEVSLEQYWQDPVEHSIRAYEVLGMDGLMSIAMPRRQDDYRIVDHESYIHARPDLSLEDALRRIEEMPTPEDIEGDFDFEQEYAAFSQDQRTMQARCGSMVWMPAQWGAGARVSWYGDFGYENFFCIVAAYEWHARKLMETGGAHGYNRGRLIARAVQDGLFPHALLLGEDICSQRGPMISLEFMDRYYAPALRHGLEPLLEAGCRPVWHCDGDVRPMLDMLFDCGVQGLQGFQPECGMTIDAMVRRRTREGNRLLIFGPLSVTTELPVCTPAEVCAKVRHAVEVCQGNADLVLFTANTINPDIPLENIRAMYDEIRN